MSGSLKVNLAAAMSSVRKSLATAPLAVAAVVAVAGMVPSQAKAENFESLGRFIGYELGSKAGTGYDAASRVGGRVLEMVGESAGRKGDAASVAKAEKERLVAEAREQAMADAAADAAYVAERKRLDPSYQPSAAESYAAVQRRASVTSASRGGLQSNNDAFQSLMNQYARQNGRASQR